MRPPESASHRCRPGPGPAPGVREQVGEVRPGCAGGQLGQELRQVGPRVEAVPLGAGADAQQDGRRAQAAVAADMEPVGPADGDGTDGPFGRPVVDGEPRVVQVSNQGRPLVPGITDRLTEQTRKCSPSSTGSIPAGGTSPASPIAPAIRWPASATWSSPRGAGSWSSSSNRTRSGDALLLLRYQR